MDDAEIAELIRSSLPDVAAILPKHHADEPEDQAGPERNADPRRPVQMPVETFTEVDSRNVESSARHVRARRAHVVASSYLLSWSDRATTGDSVPTGHPFKDFLQRVESAVEAQNAPFEIDHPFFDRRRVRISRFGIG